jgi:hypothetical protein
MFVQEVMSREPVTVTCLPVVDDGRRLVGGVDARLVSMSHRDWLVDVASELSGVLTVEVR